MLYRRNTLPACPYGSVKYEEAVTDPAACTKHGMLTGTVATIVSADEEARERRGDWDPKPRLNPPAPSPIKLPLLTVSPPFTVVDESRNSVLPDPGLIVIPPALDPVIVG